MRWNKLNKNTYPFYKVISSPATKLHNFNHQSRISIRLFRKKKKFKEDNIVLMLLYLKKEVHSEKFTFIIKNNLFIGQFI